MGDNNLNLPPGFRFYPTDEELVVHFLQRKTQLLPCHPDVIPDLDLSPYDPWDLEGKAMSEGNKWYFYSRRTKRRVTGSGHWQPVGLEEPIYSSHDAQKVGLKKHWEFYVGETKSKTNWVMQEYSLVDSSSNRSLSRRRSSKIDYSKWIVCRVYEVVGSDGDDGDGGAELSCLDEVFLSMDDLDEISLPN